MSGGLAGAAQERSPRTFPLREVEHRIPLTRIAKPRGRGGVVVLPALQGKRHDPMTASFRRNALVSIRPVAADHEQYSEWRVIGDRPFTARDRSANFWPLAIASMGKS